MSTNNKNPMPVPMPFTLEELNIPDKADKTNDPALRSYIALYKGKKIEVMAPTSYEAQTIAAKLFKAKKSYEVDVYLADIVHSTGGL